MKNKGIWLDKEKAHIVTLGQSDEQFITVTSNVENYRIHGGSGTRIKGGPQDVVQDRRYLEREKHQLKAYFKELAEKVKDADVIAIFGPAETQQKFNKELEENFRTIYEKVKTVKVVDSMTDNQVKALVRDFFNEPG